MRDSDNFSVFEKNWVVTENVFPDEAMNATASSEEVDYSKWVHFDTFIGLVLAFSSCFFIGISVIFKKLALNDIESHGGTRAVDGGFGYLRLPRWWLGISLMGIGEITNFVAYIFAPAILVTPLGVFSIVCTAALSPYFLKEHLRTVGKLGCLLVLVGCVIVTLCGPKDREVRNMEELQAQLLHPGFLIYASIVVSCSVFLMMLVPRFGHKYVLLYITICSSFGSLSVMFCKGVGLAIKQTIMGENGFSHWAAWVCLACLVGCILLETVYMQRALDLFNSSVFMSVNYVFFTSLVIVASSILYTELREMGWKNILLTILGFVVNIVALFLLHVDKQAHSENNIVTSDIEAKGGPGKPPQEEISPDQEPETALMVKPNTNLVVKDITEYSRSSALSKIDLIPTNTLVEGSSKNNTFLSYLNQDSIPVNSNQQHRDHGQHENEDLGQQLEHGPQTPSSRSSLSCNDDCSFSSESNSSDNSSLGDQENLSKSKNPSDTCGTRQSLCEVPLIDELQSSSHWNSLHDDGKSSLEITCEDDAKIGCGREKRNAEVFPDTDEDTHLV